jgi:hypothetical protein
VPVICGGLEHTNPGACSLAREDAQRVTERELQVAQIRKFGEVWISTTTRGNFMQAEFGTKKKKKKKKKHLNASGSARAPMSNQRTSNNCA